MTDFVLIQNFLTGGLLSYSALASVNIVQYRKLRAQGQIDYSAVYAIPRNGKSGCGVLVEMPVFSVASPGVSGPIGDLICPVAVLEEPNLNMEPIGGTMLAAEEVAQLILDQAHLWGIAGLGQFRAHSTAIEEATEWDGLVGYRVKLAMKFNRKQTGRTAMPLAVNASGTVTLSCGTAGAGIYYTGDGSFPGPGEATATLYTAPFAATPGTTIYFAAWLAGQTGSEVNQITI